jgi:hypothetical protein
LTDTRTNCFCVDFCTIDITVNDNEAPSVTGCADFAVDADDTVNCRATSADLSSVAATDNCDGSLSVVCTPPAPYADGTTITCTATDAANNPGSWLVCMLKTLFVGLTRTRWLALQARAICS